MANEDSYFEAARAASDAYDKTVLWFAGGSIALSAKYVTDNLDRVAVSWSLITGWSLLVLSVVALLAALMCSVLASLFEYARKDEAPKNRWTLAVKALNWFALVAVAAGVFFVLWYFYLQT